MSSFTEPLTVTKHGRWWVTAKQFTYYVGEDKNSVTITVPRGFHTDFASVPRVFWIILPPDGKYTQAAVLHDYLYSEQICERKTADRIFINAMKVLGVPLWKRRVMYRAVRMFGWIPWSKK